MSAARIVAADWLAGALACALACACGASPPVGASVRVPREPRPLPAQGPALTSALDDLGRRLYTAVTLGLWEEVLFNDTALEAVLQPVSVLAIRQLESQPTFHRAVVLSSEQRRLWAGARYAGLCIQQGRLEPASGPLALRAPGFVVARALLIGREPGGGAIAGWVEGDFVHTDVGFGALDIEHVETPRRDHADLELQVCELRVLADAHKGW